MNTTTTLIALAALPAVALAHGEGDVGLLVQNGRIVTAVANDETGEFADIGERVFGAEIDFVTNLGDEPGFFTTDGPTLPAGYSTFTPGSTITYRTNGALQEWNGSEFVSTANRLRQIVVPGVLEILTPTDGSTVDGFEYAYAGGEFDEHPDYALQDGSEAGIFLWNITFGAVDSAGNALGDSESLFIVFNFGLSEAEHEAALEYAESIVPAPGVLAPLAFAGVLATRRRR
jgi:hypothetical protein